MNTEVNTEVNTEESIASRVRIDGVWVDRDEAKGFLTNQINKGVTITAMNTEKVNTEELIAGSVRVDGVWVDWDEVEIEVGEYDITVNFGKDEFWEMLENELNERFEDSEEVENELERVASDDLLFCELYTQKLEEVNDKCIKHYNAAFL